MSPSSTNYSTTSPKAQADHSGTASVNIQTGIGIGLAIAAFIIFVILCAVWFLIRRHNRQKRSRTNGQADEHREVFDSFGSTLVHSRNSIPLQEVHGKCNHRVSEMMTPAISHEVSATPPTRNGQPAEMPTIWNEGYRGRRGSQIRPDSEVTIRMSEEAQVSERGESEANGRSEASPDSEEDARYTFLID